MSGPQDEFDDAVMAMLQLDEEEVRALRNTIMNLNYEELYKPLYQRQIEFMKKTQRTYIILILLILIAIALNLSRLW